MSPRWNKGRSLVVPFAVIAAIAVLVLSTAVGLSQLATRSPVQEGATVAALNGAGAGTDGNASGGSASTCVQASVPLGAAGNFRVLAGTTVTNTGATVVKGNLGVSPGSAVTGFPPGKVTGTQYIADTAAANAQIALAKAYANAMGRTNCPTSVAGNIGGKTLSPGLYVSTSSLAISSGDLTLTAKGHSNAVFIFKIATKFTTSSGRSVILAGGALASNIYWVVGSSATLGTTSVVYGTILAHKSISMATGSTLHGRALAHIGAVTLAGNVVTHTTAGAPAAVSTPTLAVSLTRVYS